MRIITRRDTGLLTQWTFGSSSLDTDAAAFLIAAGITDSIIVSAINTLVISMKGNNTWVKMIAIYPFVGGTATTHKFNLRNPADTNAAFRLNFVGGWTHSSNGALPNGTNAYADTFLNTSTNLTKTSAHFSNYIRTNSNAGQPYDIGNSSNLGATTNPSSLITRYSDGRAYILIADQSFLTFTSTTDSRGFTFGGTNGSSTQKLFKNGSIVATGTQGAGSLANFSLYIAANNGAGTANLFSNKETAFISIGTGLSDAEAATLYTYVQEFQTTLSRNV
jgi:hypothetical protein